MDNRLKKNTSAGRENRGVSDLERQPPEESFISSDERRKMFRSEWLQEALPNPPEIKGFHLCWLSTTNQYDPIHKRVRLGYTPVKAEEVPGFENYKVKSGEHAGLVAVNEMILYKLPMDVYQEMMTELHHSSSSSSNQLKSTVAGIFNIKSDFNIDEAYSETWAIIYHSVFISYISMKQKNLRTFLMNMDVCLQTERLYKLFQCNKILDFMGLKYEELYDDVNKKSSLALYRENTNVFSYCILACIFLNDYLSFLKWCINNNTDILHFSATDNNFKQFGVFIKSQYKSKTFLDGLKHANGLLIKNKEQKDEFMLYRTNMCVFQM